MWRKSSYSTGQGACVEVDMADPAVVNVADSKDTDPRRPVLHYTPAEWSAFVAGVKAGEFDRPVGASWAPTNFDG